jgi:hypothetical protein
MVVHICNPSYKEGEEGESWSEADSNRSERLYLKNKLKAKG